MADCFEWDVRRILLVDKVPGLYSTGIMGILFIYIYVYIIRIWYISEIIVAYFHLISNWLQMPFLPSLPDVVCQDDCIKTDAPRESSCFAARKVEGGGRGVKRVDVQIEVVCLDLILETASGPASECWSHFWKPQIRPGH